MAYSVFRQCFFSSLLNGYIHLFTRISQPVCIDICIGKSNRTTKCCWDTQEQKMIYLRECNLSKKGNMKTCLYLFTFPFLSPTCCIFPQKSSRQKEEWRFLALNDNNSSLSLTCSENLPSEGRLYVPVETILHKQVFVWGGRKLWLSMVALTMNISVVDLLWLICNFFLQSSGLARAASCLCTWLALIYQEVMLSTKAFSAEDTSGT